MKAPDSHRVTPVLGYLVVAQPYVGPERVGVNVTHHHYLMAALVLVSLVDGYASIQKGFAYSSSRKLRMAISRPAVQRMYWTCTLLSFG